VHVFKELDISGDVFDILKKMKVDLKLLEGLKYVLCFIIFLNRGWCIKSLREGTIES